MGFELGPRHLRFNEGQNLALELIHFGLVGRGDVAAGHLLGELLDLLHGAVHDLPDKAIHVHHGDHLFGLGVAGGVVGPAGERDGQHKTENQNEALHRDPRRP